MNTTTEADGVGSKALLGLSPELSALFPKMCRPRKKHRCRLCAGDINVDEPCCRWDYLVPGEGYGTSHAHPECYQVTLDRKWDEGDWECAQPGDIARPNANMEAPNVTPPKKLRGNGTCELIYSPWKVRKPP